MKLTFVKWILASAISLLLIMSSLGTALASPWSDSEASKHGLFGTVVMKSDTSLTVRTVKDETFELAVTSDTRFHIPGKEEGSMGDVAIGSRVAILATGEVTSMSALKVMLLPSEPQREHRVLTVVDISGKTLIAEDSNGNRVEVELDKEISADIKGQLVIFIGAKSEQSNRFKANLGVKINQIVKRLESHVKKLEADVKVESNSQLKAGKEKEIANLKARLEANMRRHLDIIAELISKAPAESKPALEAALESSLRGYRVALEALGETKTNAGARLNFRMTQGSVESMDIPASQLTIATKGDAKIVVKVSKDTKIRIGKKAGTIADLSLGSQVSVRYDLKTMVAADIHVRTELETSGTIKSVDTESRVLTIETSSGAMLTLKLGPSTKVEVNGKKATIADLKANALVEVEYRLSSMEAIEVEAKNEGDVKGTVKAVDVSAGTVTILTNAGKELTLKVTGTTEVKIAGTLFGLLGISPGMPIKAEFDLASGNALEIKAAAEGNRDAQLKADGKVNGTIFSVDTVKGEFTINLDTGGHLILKVDTDTVITQNGEEIALAQLQIGYRAKVDYDLDTMIALELVAHSKPENEPRNRLEAEVHGTIKYIDLAENKMVLWTRYGYDSMVELKLDKSTIVHVEGQGSTLEDLRVGMGVEVRYIVDTRQALRINTGGKVEAETHGTIKSVDASTHTFTIQVKEGSIKQIIVNVDTSIKIEGLVSTEAALKPGMDVQVQYRTDTGVALRINATSETKGALDTDIRGKVKEVNLLVGRLLIETADGASLIVSISATTKITKGGQLSTLMDIAPGAEVKVKFRVDVSGKVADSVEILAESSSSLQLNQPETVGIAVSGSVEGNFSGTTTPPAETKSKGRVSLKVEIE